MFLCIQSRLCVLLSARRTTFSSPKTQTWNGKLTLHSTGKITKWKRQVQAPLVDDLFWAINSVYVWASGPDTDFAKWLDAPGDVGTDASKLQQLTLWMVDQFLDKFDTLLDDTVWLHSLLPNACGDDWDDFLELGRIMVLNGASQLSRRVRDKVRQWPWRLLLLLIPGEVCKQVRLLHVHAQHVIKSVPCDCCMFHAMHVCSYTLCHACGCSCACL